MRKSKIAKTRELLHDDCRIRFINGKFYQEKPRAGLCELKTFLHTTKHKHGTDLTYEYVGFYNYITHKPTLMSYHAFLYAWFKGTVPAGAEVDHIDGDTLNNNLDNLQLLTKEENIRKRSGNRNQLGGAKPIYCKELDRVFTGMYEAAKELDITYHYIKTTLNGNNPKKAKYHFSYVEENKA